MRVLFLAARMGIGYGVTVVIDELSKRLVSEGIDVDIGCLEADDHYRSYPNVFQLDPDPDILMRHIDSHSITHVVAHTSPYFELLPALRGRIKRWVWEHGDPSPELFPSDRAERERIIDNKRRNVYPLVDKVISISEFIREDIGWPMADVIYNGADHVPLQQPACAKEGPLKVGTLMRLGVGERFYKGGDLFIQLARNFCDKEKIVFSVMGKGAEADAKDFRNAGMSVHLNGTNEERSSYLQSLDVFISPSLWEGFNLPLVEAQMSGVLSIAFDVGAHPEVTPFVVSDLTELRSLLLALDSDRDMLLRYAIKAQEFCRSRFRWPEAVAKTKQLLLSNR
jgi:glycosyltransferase involved in cell wall biosynthesis